MNLPFHHIARNLTLDILGLFSKPQNGVHILGAHYLSRDSTDETTYRKLLRQLQKSVRFIRFEEAVSLISSRSSVNEALVAFSFDDGFAECYDQIAPLLEEFNTNAAFFINPNFIDGDSAYKKHFVEKVVKTPGKQPMTWEQVSELHHRGHVIGAHTLDHYCINDNNIQELERQIGDCKKVIEDHLEFPCLYFAFPFGRIEHANPKSIDIACRHYPYIFSQSDYKHYFSFQGRVINRRHFEPEWNIRHIRYFLCCRKQYI